MREQRVETNVIQLIGVNLESHPPHTRIIGEGCRGICPLRYYNHAATPVADLDNELARQ